MNSMNASYEKLLIVFLVVVCLSPSAESKDYKLYYLGGQSNMDGYGYVKDLQGADAEPVKGVMIFHGNQGLDCQNIEGRGLWTELKPGNGAGFTSDGTKNVYSDPWHFDSAGYIDLGIQFAEAVHPGNNRRN
ncbi:MAG: hypothetical protein O2856_16190 [Planctomycetota bacterium]|nr:hypothetical protein [Planctomycetota bacterium]